MSFHEVRFPIGISYGSQGGPVRKTNIVELDSGYEHRNTNWQHSRRRYNTVYGVKTYDLMHELLEFWEARRGPLYGFRYKDWSDYKSCAPAQTPTATDQVIGTGDDATDTFQIVKNYTSDSNTYTRNITKLVAGTLLIAFDGVTQASGWTANVNTGIITFDTDPADGVEITAGYEFDVPVRFESDELLLSLDAFEHGNLPDIILSEIRI